MYVCDEAKLRNELNVSVSVKVQLRTLLSTNFFVLAQLTLYRLKYMRAAWQTFLPLLICLNYHEIIACLA